MLPAMVAELVLHVGQDSAGVFPPLETIGAVPVTAVTVPEVVLHVGQEITGVVPPLDTTGVVAVTAVTVPLPPPLAGRMGE